MKEETLRQIATIKRGEGGFGMIFDGHGDAGHLFLSDGNVRNGDIIVNRDTRSITAKEFAGAIISRYEHKLIDAEHPDLYIFSSCISTDFVHHVREELERHRVPVPMMLATSEVGQYSVSVINNPYGSNILEGILTLDGGGRREPTIGDLIHYIREDGQFLYSNPSFFVPDEEGKGVQIGHAEELQDLYRDDTYSV